MADCRVTDRSRQGAGPSRIRPPAAKRPRDRESSRRPGHDGALAARRVGVFSEPEPRDRGFDSTNDPAVTVRVEDAAPTLRMRSCNAARGSLVVWPGDSPTLVNARRVFGGSPC